VPSGTKTTATYTPTLADPWTSGATIAAKVQYSETGGATYEGTLNVPIVTYAEIPVSLATAIGTGATPGMKWRTYQTAAGHGTVISGAENVLATTALGSEAYVVNLGEASMTIIDAVSRTRAAARVCVEARAHNPLGSRPTARRKAGGTSLEATAALTGDGRRPACV